MMKYKISVLIPTQDRPLFLTRCLDSLKSQTILPDQIVIVDNGSGSITRKIINDFKKYFKVTYAKERKRGEAFARNKALKLAKGEIFVFIDDDCVADKDWLKNIHRHFKKHTDSDGFVGKTENYLKDNLYANIYQCYYLRWLMENFKEINRTQPLTKENSFFDTKNVALRKDLIEDFSFDPDVLFHSINVDNVAGSTLLKRGKFFYNPKVVVYHQNWDSFKNLMVKNFFQGMADQLILEKKDIDSRKKIYKYSFFKWLKICHKEIKDLNFFKKTIFWLMLFIYPMPYKIGRLSYKIKRALAK